MTDKVQNPRQSSCKHSAFRGPGFEVSSIWLQPVARVTRQHGQLDPGMLEVILMRRARLCTAPSALRIGINISPVRPSHRPTISLVTSSLQAIHSLMLKSSFHPHRFPLSWRLVFSQLPSLQVTSILLFASSLIQTFAVLTAESA